MILDIAVGDRVRTVRVVRKEAMLHVTLDGCTHVVDARRVSDGELSILIQNGRDAAATRSVDAAFWAGANGDLEVHVLGRSIPVELRPLGGPSTRLAHASRAPGSLRAGSQKIVAPMPGKIVRVLVKTGDQVKAKQGLVVVEAMKMENELRAARDGRVRDVSVAAGQSVEAGAVLLVVE